MAAAGASGRGGLGRVWVFSGWALGLCSLLASGTRPAAATTHWVVTEDGKIQQQVSGPRDVGRCPPGCGGTESPCPRRHSPIALVCPELRGTRPGAKPCLFPQPLQQPGAGAGRCRGPGTGVSRSELASLVKRGLNPPEPRGEASGRGGWCVGVSRGWISAGALEQRRFLPAAAPGSLRHEAGPAVVAKAAEPRPRLAAGTRAGPAPGSPGLLAAGRRCP